MRSLFLVAALAAPLPVPEMIDLGQLRIDQVQYIETHNSYHLAPDPEVTVWLETAGFHDGSWSGPQLARAIGYSNLPLTTQLELGIRAFELDVNDDPTGTRFVRPGFIDHLRAAGLPQTIPWDPAGVLRKPGFKTIHKADYDPRSTCPLFADCLGEIARWSDAHPAHVPILLMLEVKRAATDRCPDLCADGWHRLEKELVGALWRNRILTPADAGTGWPTIDAARGKILIFLLDAEETARSYRAGQNRQPLLFTGARPGKGQPLPSVRPRWAILPRPDDPRIGTAIRQGMLAYTRADADTGQARADDPVPRDRAFASGAQIVSTDYPVPDRRLSNYTVRFADGRFVRCNPVTAAGRC